MEENIAIESESREKFEKTVKGIKKMLKSGKINPVETVEAMVEEKKKDKKDKSNPITKNRGVVYIGHIPHGFYEDQMKSFFSQFGKVTNVRVARSPKTGRSKGYGFVEFLNKEVAQIAAETMHNYLMDKRLLKAEYIPPEKQRAKAFNGKRWIPGKSCPGIFKRKKEIMKKNSHVTTEQWLHEAKKRMKRLHKLKATLKAVGIDYDFFQPVDVPEELSKYNPGEPNQQFAKKDVKAKKGDGSEGNKKKTDGKKLSKEKPEVVVKSKNKKDKQGAKLTEKESMKVAKKIKEEIKNSSPKKSSKKENIEKTSKVFSPKTKAIEKKAQKKNLSKPTKNKTRK